MNAFEKFGATLGMIGALATGSQALAQRVSRDTFILATIPRIESPRDPRIWAVIQPTMDGIPMDRAPIGFLVDSQGNAVERICGPVFVRDGRAHMLIDEISGRVLDIPETIGSSCLEPPTDAVVHRIDIGNVPR